MFNEMLHLVDRVSVENARMECASTRSVKVFPIKQWGYEYRFVSENQLIGVENPLIIRSNFYELFRF